MTASRGSAFTSTHRMIHWVHGYPGPGDDDLSNDFFQLCLWWTFGDWRFPRSLWSPGKFP